MRDLNAKIAHDGQFFFALNAHFFSWYYPLCFIPF